jgi:hypothetical protein
MGFFHRRVGSTAAEYTVYKRMRNERETERAPAMDPVDGTPRGRFDVAKDRAEGEKSVADSFTLPEL